MLVASSGGLIGLITLEGRALSKSSGDSFTAQVWLENDGDTASQAEAAARPGLSATGGLRYADLGGPVVASLTGRGALEHLPEACTKAAIVLLSVKVETAPEGCVIYDEKRLIQTGALAIWPEGQGLRIDSVADHAGQRPWTGAR